MNQTAPHSAPRPFLSARSPRPFLSARFHWNTLWIALFLSAIGIFLFATPLTSDDFSFQEKFTGWYLDHGMQVPEENLNAFSVGDFPFHQTTEAWKQRIQTDNSRLGNLIVTPLLLFPKWVGMTLAYAAFLIGFFKCLSLASLNRRRSPLVSLAIFLWTFFFPWRDSMASMVFAFNYIIPSGLSLWLVSLVLGKPSTVRPAKILLLSFLTGWWHEGFCLPLIVGFLLLLCLRPEFRRKQTFLALVGLTCGLLFIIVPGSFGNRVDNTVKWGNLLDNLPFALIISVPYILFFLIWMWMRRRRRKIAENPTVTFMLASGFVPIVLLLATYSQSRLITWSICASVTGILYLLNHCRLPHRKAGALFLHLSQAVLLVLSFAHLGVADYYAFRIRSYFYRGIHEFNINPDRTIFGEVLTQDKLPMIAFNMPDALVFNTSVEIINRTRLKYYNETPSNTFAIIPQELRNTTVSSGTKLQGNLNARAYNGRIFAPRDSSAGQPTRLIDYSNFEVDFGRGYVRKPICILPYRSEADGRQYWCILPYSSWVDFTFGEIKGIRYNPR